VHSHVLSLLNWVHIVLSKSRCTWASTFLTFFFTIICCIIWSTNILPSEALTVFAQSYCSFIFSYNYVHIQTERTGISKTYHTFKHQISAKQRASHLQLQTSNTLADILVFISTLAHNATTTIQARSQIICYNLYHLCKPGAEPGGAESSWNVMAHGDAREGKWRGNWRMKWVSSTLHTTSEHGASSITRTTADAHTSAASSRLNWRPHRFKWTRPFRRKTKSGLCACVITFKTQLASYT
jgi:hypothetical protein